jgi:hypothetical protein
MRINVTQEHIENGVSRHPGCCPVALALKDINPKSDPCVCYSNIFYTDGLGERHFVTSPNAVRGFVSRFDNSKPVEPFSFNLNIPEAQQ